MTRNKLWLYHGYRRDGTLIGELEGTDAGHALTEFEAEFGDTCVRVVRVKGSGRPWPKVTPAPGIARYVVVFKLDGRRRQATVRTGSVDDAKNLFEGVRTGPSGAVAHVLSVTPK